LYRTRRPCPAFSQRFPKSPFFSLGVILMVPYTGGPRYCISMVQLSVGAYGPVGRFNFLCRSLASPYPFDFSLRSWFSFIPFHRTGWSVRLSKKSPPPRPTGVLFSLSFPSFLLRQLLEQGFRGDSQSLSFYIVSVASV